MKKAGTGLYADGKNEQYQAEVSQFFGNNHAEMSEK